MKKIGKLVTGAVVIALLGGSYVVLKNQNQKRENAEAATEEEQQLVLELAEEDIMQMKLSLSDGEVILEKTEESWAVQGETDFPLKQSSVTSIVSKLSGMKAERVLEDIEDLSEYGLEDTKQRISILDQDHVEHDLYIGDKNTATGQYYVKTEEAGTVYVVASSDIPSLEGSIYNFAQVEDLPTISSTDIQEIKIQQGEEGYQIQASTDAYSGWFVAENGKNQEDKEEADSSSVYTLCSNLGTLAFTSMVDYKPENLKKYGLEEPQDQISISYTETVEVEAEEADEGEDENAQAEEVEASEAGSDQDEEETEEAVKEITVERQLNLKLGDSQEDQRFVQVDGEDTIYTIAETQLTEILGKKASDYYDLTVCYAPIARMEGLTVEIGEEAHTIEAIEQIVEKEEEQAEDKTDEATEEVDAEAGEQEDTATEEAEPETETVYEMDGKSIDSLAFKTFYSAAVSQTAQSRLEETFTTKNSPELRLKFEQQGGEIVEVAYYPYDSNFYIGIREDGRQYLVNKVKIKQLLEDWTEFIEEVEK